jgi:plastocyanin
MDPVDFRRKNLVVGEEETAWGESFEHNRATETMEAAVEAAGYDQPRRRYVGKGVAIGDRGQGGGTATVDITLHPDGSATVVVLAQMYAYLPAEIRVPAHRPVTFRLTSPDVIHGFQIVGSNGNTMVVPGYVSEFTTTFQPGNYLIVCNEFCGVGHHIMMGKLVAEVTP